MDRESMTNEENYCFDVAGYLIVRGALTPKEVETLNRTLDKGGRTEGMLGWPASLREPFRDLMVHPILVWYLNQIVGPGFRLDRPPRLIGDTAGDAVGPLTGGDEPRDPARAYYHQNGYRSCQGVRAIWALSDVNAGDGGFVMVPCSHKGNVETPEDILTGKDDMGLTLQPVLKAGDLLLCAETLVHGLRPWKEGPQRLLTYWYAGRAAIQSNGPDAPEAPSPEWMNELTPAERAVLHKPGYRGSDPSPTLNTDGKTCWVEEASRVIHPSIYVRDPNSTIDYNSMIKFFVPNTGQDFAQAESAENLGTVSSRFEPESAANKSNEAPSCPLRPKFDAESGEICCQFGRILRMQMRIEAVSKP